MKKLAVFCGSSSGASSIYIEEAKKLGKELAKRNIALVYGGASVGVMGAVADSLLEEGGHVIGVMPTFLENREIAHKKLTELFIVDTMHERKAKMADLADGFIALPGGPGTLEEFFEIFTWAQLGLHQKPCGLLNINHYYDPLLALFDHMTKEQFLHEKYRHMALVSNDSKDLLDQFNTYEPPAVKTYSTNK
ncbi:TIGR00730 family Rossman fold protein [Heyndrickxia oleronia]|uniref:Cytokinin riboside 5'-monophosphate phosphoribohydrolase n=1 Tax=Heyndrickxia oleronia TaxID=38875 RepID=A0A8E2II53_9BACI|nr:TIGR00730 family Rossman fold protein [Heyndrickxia oleronia]MEC1373724.1 TIGR00730 family Rossman fold protein [Heyndrickxia oleronia]OOP70336.1 Rossman fold protein, TIGR00730 family [Heyndrickxia oleronia]QQZ05453.1 TIGR00730 family Rossman fold protein [Heyndrickxia oleronia]GIN41915.1 cytokinin riboside 5'-monophosphate phosphoribohydrolase [Heyndrickxia oleronia]